MGLHHVVGLEKRLLADLPIRLELDLMPPRHMHLLKPMRIQRDLDTGPVLLERNTVQVEVDPDPPPPDAARAARAARTGSRTRRVRGRRVRVPRGWFQRRSAR